MLAANHGGRFGLPKKAENPLKMGSDPELNTSSSLDPHVASDYLTVISVLRWMIKLGRIDIITKMSLLSSYVVLPSKGNLDAAEHHGLCWSKVQFQSGV